MVVVMVVVVVVMVVVVMLAVVMMMVVSVVVVVVVAVVMVIVMIVWWCLWLTLGGFVPRGSQNLKTIISASVWYKWYLRCRLTIQATTLSLWTN